MRSLGSRLGLRARMTASYVVVTAVAVLVVEGIAIGVVIPDLLAQADLSSRVKATAAQLADSVGLKVTGTATDQPAVTTLPLVPIGDPNARVKPGVVTPDGNGIVIPQVSGDIEKGELVPASVVISPEGRIVATSFPARYPMGANADGLLPRDWQYPAKSGNTATQDGATIVWATTLIFPNGVQIGSMRKADPVSTPDATAYEGKGKFLGTVYVQAPELPGVVLPSGSMASLAPLLQTGLVLLILTVPLGVVFGLLTTRGVVRRLRGLAAGTVAFAGGDFSLRVPVSGRDEVSQLERHFNDMAERLALSMEEQRVLTERNARLAERSRISRELHDSISQDLFSLSALSAGLQQALPAGSPLQPQLNTLSLTVGTMIQEMRALLLELRPTALDGKGLSAALDELCDAYQDRVGIRVTRNLASVQVPAEGEGALFRVAQESLANAARHSDADEVAVRLQRVGGRVELTVEDRGRGFDPGQAARGHGMGLKLIAERVHELAGSFEVASQVGHGARITVSLPVPP
jgi:signal transduction histidine kinase